MKYFKRFRRSVAITSLIEKGTCSSLRTCIFTKKSMLNPGESIEALIGKILNEAGADPESDVYVPTKELWEKVLANEEFENFGPLLQEKLRRRFLTVLHSSRSSLAFFESKQDPTTYEISWKLRTPIQDISLFTTNADNSFQTPSERNSKRIEDLQKEVRRLRSEIHQLEIENSQWQQTIERVKKGSPQNVLQGFNVYEKYSHVIDEFSATFTTVENSIIDIGNKHLKPLQKL